MYLDYHGGGCCGIKTLHAVGQGPETNLYRSIGGMYRHTNTHYDPVTKVSAPQYKQNYFTGEAPTETAGKRLDRLLEFHDELQPNGIVELTLRGEGKSSQYGVTNQLSWVPFILKRGFVEVASSMNSNSGNRIHIYLRIKDVPSKKKGE